MDEHWTLLVIELLTIGFGFEARGFRKVQPQLVKVPPQLLVVLPDAVCIVLQVSLESLITRHNLRARHS